MAPSELRPTCSLSSSFCTGVSFQRLCFSPEGSQLRFLLLQHNCRILLLVLLCCLLLLLLLKFLLTNCNCSRLGLLCWPLLYVVFIIITIRAVLSSVASRSLLLLPAAMTLLLLPIITTVTAVTTAAAAISSRHVTLHAPHSPRLQQLLCPLNICQPRALQLEGSPQPLLLGLLGPPLVQRAQQAQLLLG